MLLDDKTVDIFITSKIGSFKHIQYHTESSNNTKKCIENLQDIKSLEKEDGVTSMTWGNEEQTEILIGRKNQQVQIYDTAQASFTKTVSADFGKGEVIGVGKYKRRLITALAGGVVKVWSKKKEKEVILDTGGPLDRLRCCPDNPLIFGTGGNENELKLWQIGNPAPIFQAKNLSHDWLELRQPIWVSDLSFVPGSDGKVVAACSRYGYVRLYDSRAQRRPVCNVEFKAMAATCMTHSFDDKQVIVGFGRGQLQQVDLRAKGRPDKVFKGSIGSMMDIALVRDPKLVVSVSLDRYVKIHDYDTKALVYKQYLTSKLSHVLVQTARSTPLQNNDDEEIKEEDAEVKSEDEMDEIFDNMDTIVDKCKKKKGTIDKEHAGKRLKPDGDADESNPEEAIVKLLKLTEKKKKRIAEKKREKKAKSVYHNA